MLKKLKIVIVASEAAPYAKTGGMADVCGALPLELARQGHQVLLVVPFYKCIRKKRHGIRKTKNSVSLPLAGKEVFGTILTKKINPQFRLFFIANDDYYNRDELYGTSQGDYADNGLRFGFFCKAVLELLPKIGFQPDIIHANDWQTGLIPFFLKTEDKYTPFYNNTKTILSIHNLAYQGLFDKSILAGLGISRDWYNMNGIEYYDKVNYLKAGLISADEISTVSKKYSLEMQTHEYGCGLDGVLRVQRGHIEGILNGVDYAEWHPETDKHIAKNYSRDNMSGKLQCRHALMQEFNLQAKDETPIIGIISRLADQKGFDILAKGINELVAMDLRIVLLGTGDEKYHLLFRKMQQQYPDHFAARLAFNNGLAHRIEAGSDMFLMPSRYEPCGLNQIYSLKYGTVPIVRATGGLDDTIDNFNPQTGKGNGFKFTEYSVNALVKKVKEALEIFKNRDLWHKLVKNGMDHDFSWKQSAQEYIALYRKILDIKN